MATGCRAFLRESVAQTLTAIIENDTRLISELNPHFPPLRWIIGGAWRRIRQAAMHRPSILRTNSVTFANTLPRHRARV
jgi:hypothetical protein